MYSVNEVLRDALAEQQRDERELFGPANASRTAEMQHIRDGVHQHVEDVRSGEARITAADLQRLEEIRKELALLGDMEHPPEHLEPYVHRTLGHMQVAEASRGAQSLRGEYRVATR